MTPDDLLGLLLGTAAIAASLAVLRWAWRRPRVIRIDVYRSAAELLLETGRIQAINVEGIKRIDRLVLEYLSGSQDLATGRWTITAVWKTASECEVLRFRSNGKGPRSWPRTPAGRTVVWRTRRV